MTDAIGQTASAAGSTASTTAVERKGQLGQDAFLQLLVTQLKHQDPTAPQENAELIAQLATFSSLEQLTEIKQTLKAIGGALGVDTTQFEA
jgi:flagellar basal-body rod modification protein FlgD